MYLICPGRKIELRSSWLGRQIQEDMPNPDHRYMPTQRPQHLLLSSVFTPNQARQQAQ